MMCRLDGGSYVSLASLKGRHKVGFSLQARLPRMLSARVAHTAHLLFARLLQFNKLVVTMSETRWGL
jgi:hypothetical protein